MLVAVWRVKGGLRSEVNEMDSSKSVELSGLVLEPDCHELAKCNCDVVGLQGFTVSMVLSVSGRESWNGFELHCLK